MRYNGNKMLFCCQGRKWTEFIFTGFSFWLSSKFQDRRSLSTSGSSSPVSFPLYTKGTTGTGYLLSHTSSCLCNPSEMDTFRKHDFLPREKCSFYENLPEFQPFAPTSMCAPPDLAQAPEEAIWGCPAQSWVEGAHSTITLSVLLLPRHMLPVQRKQRHWLHVVALPL